jgi:hypothetical protein
MKPRKELHIIQELPRSGSIFACGGQGIHACPGPGRIYLKAFNRGSPELTDVGKRRPLCSLTNHRYIGGLRTFWALRDFEFNLITLSQGRSFTLNGSTMNEYILSLFHFNKPKALLLAEPLDSTLGHYNLPAKAD